jgi:rsbT antagonist protein RsbS
MRDDALVSATQVQQCLVVTVRDELSEEALAQLQGVAMGRVSAQRLHTVILDLSAVQVLDGHEFGCLKSLAGTLRLLGATMLMVGLRPSVIAYLASADVDISGVPAALDLDAALRRLSIRVGHAG